MFMSNIVKQYVLRYKISVLMYLMSTSPGKHINCLSSMIIQVSIYRNFHNAPLKSEGDSNIIFKIDLLKSHVSPQLLQREYINCCPH